MAVVAAATLLFASCSVHEWPYEEVEPELPKYPLTLHLNYLTELPQYVIVDYEVSRSDAQAEAEAEPAHDRRYTLEVYKIINEYTSKKGSSCATDSPRRSLTLSTRASPSSSPRESTNSTSGRTM